MADEVTSTDRKLLYTVRFSPGGEKFVVEAGGASTAQQKGIGLATLEDIYFNGIDVYRSTENEITDYLGDGEEE